MYVHPIVEANTNHQLNPYTMTKISAVPVGKTASEISFAEFLKNNLKQASQPAVVRQTENQIAGILWGYLQTTKSISKSEPKLKDVAS